MELKLSRRERGFNGFDEFGEPLFHGFACYMMCVGS